jgi:glycosyltransferase involved in cell wall biosynthesis
VIVPGEPIAGDVAEELSVPADRIFVVPHGIGPAFAPAATPEDAVVRIRLGLPARYVLWVGSLHGVDPRKGLDLLFEALLGLDPAERPPLVLAGRPGTGSAWAQEQASRGAIELVLAGYVTDQELAALYRGAAVSVVPSRHEGFGLPALEALACGTPLLVTDGGTLPSVTGDAALVVSAGRADAIAGGLRAVLNDSELGDRLRDLGPKRAARFSWTRAAEQTTEVYERLAARGGW